MTLVGVGGCRCGLRTDRPLVCVSVARGLWLSATKPRHDSRRGGTLVRRIRMSGFLCHVLSKAPVISKHSMDASYSLVVALFVGKSACRL